MSAYAPTLRRLNRPAKISPSCGGCGAPTRGRESMTTELLEMGALRVLRVVACSACPDTRANLPHVPLAPRDDDE